MKSVAGQPEDGAADQLYFWGPTFFYLSLLSSLHVGLHPRAVASQSQDVVALLDTIQVGRTGAQGKSPLFVKKWMLSWKLLFNRLLHWLELTHPPLTPSESRNKSIFS